jgi:hypothetical protein
VETSEESDSTISAEHISVVTITRDSLGEWNTPSQAARLPFPRGV